MTERAHMPDNGSSLVRNTLELMPRADFVSAWRAIVGEPPAVMLKSRSEMIRLLVESVPAAHSQMWLTDGQAQHGAEPFPNPHASTGAQQQVRAIRPQAVV